MSLLLDALKKAADDKNKASQQSSNISAEATVASDTSSHTKIDTPVVKHTKTSDSTDKTDTAKTVVDDEELTLDAIEDETPVEIDAGLDTAIKTKDNKALRPQNIKQQTQQEALSLNPGAYSEERPEGQPEEQPGATASTSYTVSDEALSMLIYKTNHVVKHSRRVVLGSVLLASLLVLIAGGFYYYTEMQTEIAALERKHHIAMQSMRLKTSKEKIPAPSEMIHNLVSEADLDDKVLYVKKHIAQDKKSHQQVSQRSTAPAKNNNATGVSFQKNTKVDPVAQKLALAWNAYHAEQYGQAKTLYREVLKREKNNRDALLGLGAIAVLEENYSAAKAAYYTLLKHDPRDPIAIAALASLKSPETAAADLQHLLKMVRKNPTDAHLNFALGNNYAQQGEWKLAQQAYFNAWQSDPNNADYTFNLAVSLDQLGQRQQALKFYRDSLKKSAGKTVAFSRPDVEKRLTELSRL